jgi:catechol 2,3-dioxygenase-like lactoylglutathione lyase family enzyme
MILKYKFHHIGLFTEHPEQHKLALAGLLGHTNVCQLTKSNNEAVLLRQDWGGVMIGIFTKPFNDAYAGLAASKAPDIMHIAFEVKNLDEAKADLEAKGIPLLWQPAVSHGFRHLGVKTIEGLIAVVLESKDELVFTKEAVPASPVKIPAHNHIGLLTDTFRESEAFWSKAFNLRKTFEAGHGDEGGYFAMIDQDFGINGHDFTLEIFTPPYIFPIDQYTFDQKGNNYYHFGYLADDAAHVEQIYTHLQSKGMFPASAPYGSDDFACAFTHGPEKIVYEFITESLGGIVKVDQVEMSDIEGVTPAIPYPDGKECVITL